VKILVVNSGSSSLKYVLFDMEGEEPIARGIVEKIGEGDSVLKHKARGEESEKPVVAADHEAAFKVMLDALLHETSGVIKGLGEVDAVGHRVVHGGEMFTESTLVTREVEEAIEKYSTLAPLHNPANLLGIRAARRFFPGVPHVAVFDTAFHQTMPRVAYLYALPRELYEKYRVRRYGFHGTSHKFVSMKAAKILGVPYERFNCITAHLGNGCSLTAVREGKSVDTTMGLTPLEGPMMGTRSGSVDPGVIFFLNREAGMDLARLDQVLNRESGLLGVSGVSNDVRDLMEAGDDGNERARLALEMFAYQVRRCIGAYLAVLERTDAIVFTAGIGENAVNVRAAICRGLSALGVRLDEKRNRECVGREGRISADDSAVAVLVVPTNEELMIARDTMRVSRKAEVMK